MTGAAIDLTALEFRPLLDSCPSGAFSCGEREIDRWFRKKSHTCHEGFECRVTTVHIPGVDQPIAFYALAFIAEEERLLSRGSQSKAYFPALHLEWLAVDRKQQGGGLGTFLMGKVIDIYIQKVLTTGLPAMTLVALNERVESFYSDLGFKRYALDELGAGRRMLLPRQTALALQQA